eukprot:3593137-Alexandrium_andersonii.AAC.1
MALYAAECTPAPSCAMSTVKIEMKRAPDVGTQPAASEPLVALSWGKSSHDPELHVLLRRVLLIRLHWHRDQQWQQRIREVQLWCIEEALPGAPTEEDQCEVTEAGIGPGPP